MALRNSRNCEENIIKEFNFNKFVDCRPESKNINLCEQLFSHCLATSQLLLATANEKSSKDKALIESLFKYQEQLNTCVP